jgi:DNA-binding response OmpR family regulator
VTDKLQTLILLLSGDTRERLALRKTLKEMGCRVLLAGDAASAASIVDTQHPDAIFLDRALEEECGAITSLRASCPDLFAVPVFLMSADDEVPSDLLSRGRIYEVLQKPLEVESLEPAFARARRWSAQVSFERDESARLLSERLQALKAGEPSELGAAERRLAHAIASRTAHALSEAGSLQAASTWQPILDRLLDADFLNLLTAAIGSERDLNGTSQYGLVTDRETMSLADVLQSVAARGLTGVLTIESPRHGVRIHLDAGAIVFFDFLRIPTSLAAKREIYCSRYRIPFGELVRRTEAGDTPGPVLLQLVKEGVFPESCLADAMLEVALEVLTNCESDEAGYSLHFENGMGRRDGIPPAFELAVHTFLLKLVSRADEWGLFEHSMLADDAAFEIVVTSFEEVRLSAYEREVLDCLEQNPVVREVPMICELSTFEVCSVLYGLLRRKIVRHSTAAEAETAAP